MCFAKFFKSFFLIFVLSVSGLANASNSEDKIPLPFRGDTPGSVYKISYDDLEKVLNFSVLVTGRSNRKKARSSKASIGTRLRSKTNELTALEGNRFWFEALKHADNRELLLNIRKSLEKLPSEAELKTFSKYEQLAYWLNLYNVTILSEIVKVYPQTSLNDFLQGDDSILDKKLLTVSGIKLSLNDIQHNILMPKFGNDPKIIYGLYQGNVGGPNIRKHVFTAANVFNSLEANAVEFINSNRGTYAGDKKAFRVSSLYQRNKRYFPNFKKDLKNHLLYYLEGSTSNHLEKAKKIKANINDWNVADLFGSTRSYGGSVASSSAALIDSSARPEVTGQQQHFDGVETTFESVGAMAGGGAGNAGFSGPNLSAASAALAALSANYGRLSQQQIERLQQINQKRIDSTGSVTISKDPQPDNIAEDDNKPEEQQ